ncbi:MAG: monovalent cation/H+ antiporter subunit D [Phaeovulum sp.]|uniref:monovalent cation/H+ antiporter subunit D n=1 Tax=Phaeovulum sp. TaxID=2934796 RepID=UPI00273667AA|nr:monovalent cation/H+ antiporter subunit D [Phaeovulum sp.]MDP3860776.1 monovalent cation/H+ antiporter subunit D [Phaeovulum sp.]
MNHWIIAPVVLPALLAPLLVLLARHDLRAQRLLSGAGTVLFAALAGVLLAQSSSGEIGVYRLGNWPAPFGIALVVDRLAALMLALTAALALAVLAHVLGTGWDARGRHFHALFQFQLMGLAGAFLTGDAFNLFVFFEVMLIASYGLMIHGGGRARLRAGVQYVVMNLAGSVLFLFALGTIYAVTGTLNMADLAVRAAAIPASDAALLRVGAVLLLLVFAIKAALVPLQFWLPATYANAPGPVAALFAILTKVGVYAILRLFTLGFGPSSAASDIGGTLLLPAAGVTLLIGMTGVLGARDLGRMAAFSVIGSIGTMMLGVAVFTPAATGAALFYLIHSTLVAGALFLTADLVRGQRGSLSLAPRPRFASHGLLAAVFFVVAIGVAGMPPLPGFLGKLMILDAVRAVPGGWAIWASILVGSLMAVAGLARAGAAVFWETTPEEAAAPSQPLALAGVAGLLTVLVGLSLAAGPVSAWLNAAAASLYAPAPYIAAVLAGGAG